MVGADLEANFLIALRHDRVAEAGGQNADVAQMGDELVRARCVTDHQGYHRMFARQRLETEHCEAVPEARRHGAEMIE